MARHSATPPESLNEILSWLNSDQEVAAAMYVQLRHDLERIFRWRQCSDPEGMADEVFDRVAKKISTVKPTYEGDPRLYFRAVANNLIKENLKTVKTHVCLEDVDLAQPQTADNEEEILEIDQCLQSCLQELPTKNRELVMAYYSRQKQAKIDRRNELAQLLGISAATLRVRVYRIRVVLEKCIERCLRGRAK